MGSKSTQQPVVVIPNWNGADSLRECIDSLLSQSLKPYVIVVDNGSVDESRAILDSYDTVEVILHSENKGYAGGVNPGFKRAIELGATYVAPFNNDAVADPDWLRHAAAFLDTHPEVGIADCKVLSSDGTYLDGAGDYYTIWGLPYPRGRLETNVDAYDKDTTVFAASGAASLFRVSMLQEIGLLDEDFFAYYEDIDLSFRAQLAGWKIAYVPTARVYHQISATGQKIKGFMTYQTMKNLPWVLLKDAPGTVYWRVLPRFAIVYASFFVSAIPRGNFWWALRGFGRSLRLTPKKMAERRAIQRARAVTPDYIWQNLVHDLPPNAHKLRRLFRPFTKNTP